MKVVFDSSGNESEYCEIPEGIYKSIRRVEDRPPHTTTPTTIAMHAHLSQISKGQAAPIVPPTKYVVSFPHRPWGIEDDHPSTLPHEYHTIDEDCDEPADEAATEVPAFTQRSPALEGYTHLDPDSQTSTSSTAFNKPGTAPSTAYSHRSFLTPPLSIRKRSQADPLPAVPPSAVPPPAVPLRQLATAVAEPERPAPPLHPKGPRSLPISLETALLEKARTAPTITELAAPQPLSTRAVFREVPRPSHRSNSTAKAASTASTATLAKSRPTTAPPCRRRLCPTEASLRSPWFHGEIPRGEAERRLTTAALERAARHGGKCGNLREYAQGTFLVRSRADARSHVLSIVSSAESMESASNKVLDFEHHLVTGHVDGDGITVNGWIHLPQYNTVGELVAALHHEIPSRSKLALVAGRSSAKVLCRIPCSNAHFSQPSTPPADRRRAAAMTS
eukprot:m.165524 g.165524  ORF g.165524 m.165524 type:complete len:448 (-) comp24001_c0_seq1:230-1573(-)